MFRQKLLVLGILVVTLTGCHHHRRHPHAFRQPGLNGSCEHHHGHCRKCGRHSGRRHTGYHSLFPGDIYGQCGEGCLEEGCGTGFMECGGCGSSQTCYACETPYGNSCNDYGSCSAGTSYASCTGCSSCGMSPNTPATSSVASAGCNCGRYQVPTGAPQHFSSDALAVPSQSPPALPPDNDSQKSADGFRDPNPSGSSQESLPPVPRNVIPPAEAEPNFNGDASPPSNDPPAALPPIDAVSWQIPRLP